MSAAPVAADVPKNLLRDVLLLVMRSTFREAK
jgi:hypothetical protein